MTTNYVPLKSVLFQLNTLIDDRYFNETIAYEWAAQGLQKVRITAKLEEKLLVANIEDYKATLPDDFHYLVQLAYKEDVQTDADKVYLSNNIATSLYNNVIWSTGVKWKPIRLATSSASVNPNLVGCTQCLHSFSVSSSGVISTSLEKGCLIILYKGYPTDEDGELLIPDSQDLKEALLHYVLYNYWLSKYMMKEDGAETRVQFHLKMFSHLQKKAQNLNLPDSNQLENIGAIWNRLVSPTNRFDNLFTTMGNREAINF